MSTECVSGVWYSQSFTNADWLQKAESSCYKIYKTHFEQGKYITKLSPYFCKIFMRFRTRNHRLPVEVGRWGSIRRNQRLCSYCNELVDEFHYLFSCNHFEVERKQYLKRYYYVRPNIIKFEKLMNTKTIFVLKKLCRFINVITKHVS